MRISSRRSAFARARGVSDRVHLHGFVEESRKHELLARAWVVVMPSHKEGWGLTIVEAGLHATPAVAYSFAGGPSESIVHGRTGLLADSVEDFEEHVITLVDDARELAEVGHLPHGDAGGGQLTATDGAAPAHQDARLCL